MVFDTKAGGKFMTTILELITSGPSCLIFFVGRCLEGDYEHDVYARMYFNVAYKNKSMYKQNDCNAH